ncbi:hypothetical protein SDC9_191654 [bioreactor metagenome]|uniref:Uncharacterized protein n=1 Tax=bioreactor metagenome TaxID=1076179 RepID=A0A645I9J4_9ZZZZ
MGYLDCAQQFCLVVAGVVYRDCFAASGDGGIRVRIEEGVVVSNEEQARNIACLRVEAEERFLQGAVLAEHMVGKIVQKLGTAKSLRENEYIIA